MTRYKKTLFTSIAFAIILFSCFNFNFVTADIVEGDDATFTVDGTNLIDFGVIVPDANQYGTLKIDGTSQASFNIADWDGGAPLFTESTEGAIPPFTDITEYYPLYFQTAHYLIDSRTNNPYIDPASDVQWFAASAFVSPRPTDPFTVNAIFDAYSMTEGASIAIPVTDGIPVQVDISIASTGPKMFILSGIADDPTSPAFTPTLTLISPSGKTVTVVNMGGLVHFVAAETGKYKLLLDETYTSEQGYITLEFTTAYQTKSTIPKNTLTMLGGDPMWDLVTFDQFTASMMETTWGMISGTKGDKLHVDIGYEYLMASEPIICAWLPTSYGYFLVPNINNFDPMEFELIFPETGTIYLSFTRTSTNLYRAGVMIKSIPITTYTIGTDATVAVSQSERKAIKFTVAQDSFVRFNYTSGGSGAPFTPINYVPYIGGSATPGFFFEDSSKIDVNDYIVNWVDRKYDDDSNFYYYYYYLPAGDYEFIVKNSDINEEGFLKISSELLEQASSVIPVNTMSYPDIYPTQFATFTFDADEIEETLKKGQWTTITIPEAGQFMLNTTLLESDNTARCRAVATPSAVVLYNSSGTEYVNCTVEAAVSGDGQVFNATTTSSDFLYIAYTEKWHGMNFDFVQGSAGTGELDDTIEVMDGDWVACDIPVVDGTANFTNDGSMYFSITDNDFDDWQKGVAGQFDLPGVDEAEYYWLRIDNIDEFETVPYCDRIQITNFTIEGDLNLMLLKDSDYVYCDFWVPGDQPSSPNDLSCTYYPGSRYDTAESWFLETSTPYTIGLEAGEYKLLMIPEKWDTIGNVTLQIAALNYLNYTYQDTYTITSEPTFLAMNFTIPDNYTDYSYDVEDIFDSVYYRNPETGQYYYMIDVTGTQYAWTQLVTYVENLNIDACYIIQDLPWLTNAGPNSAELTTLGSVGDASVYEFGALTDSFTLLYRYTPWNSHLCKVGDSFENGTGSFSDGSESWETAVWLQNASDDFNWRIETTSTSSTGTGANNSAQHMTNFIYTEASTNDGFADLYTKNMYYFNESYNEQLRFYLNMYASTDETMKLYLDYNGTGSWVNVQSWEQFSTDQSVWTPITVDLSGLTGAGHLRLRGYVNASGSYRQDICLDNVFIYREDAQGNPLHWETFNLGLTQYDTTLIELGTTAVAAPGIPIAAIAIGVTVGIIIVAGAAGVIYVIMKRRS